MTTPKLSLSRMESQLAKVSRESTTVQKDEWEQFLSWAKRAREHIREARCRDNCPCAYCVESNQLLSEFGE